MLSYEVQFDEVHAELRECRYCECEGLRAVLYSGLARSKPDVTYQMSLLNLQCLFNGLFERNAAIFDSLDHVLLVDKNWSLTRMAAFCLK